MKRTILLLMTLSAFVKVQAQNPIVSHCYTADPAPVVFEGNDSLYFYCDEDMNVPGINDFYYMERWRVYSTVDMVNWTDHGVAMPRTTFSWAQEGSCWASQCIEKNGKYYWYMCAAKPNDWKHYIGVGVSDTPSGPFKDIRRCPIVETGAGGDIDPTVFTDDDGKSYLYWGNNKLYYAELRSNMIGTKRFVDVPLTVDAFGGVKVDGKIEGADCYEEGPWLDKRGDNYYLLYAAGGVPEHISYSMSKSPTGPWTYKGQVMKLQDTGSFTNHCGMVHYAGRDYFFYHTGWAKGGGGFNRSVAVEEMHIDPITGEIQPIVATRKGVGPIRTMNPYLRQQAETLNAASGIEVVGNESTGVYVTGIHTQDSMRVANVDFGENGARSIKLRIAKSTGNAVLVVRLDNSRGAVLAQIPIADTGGNDIWDEQVYDLNLSPTGVHDLHFSFLGSHPNDDESTLFNWDWWQFLDVDTAVDGADYSGGFTDVRFHTLQGVPVDHPIHGMYIRKGKKIYVP